MYGSGGAIRSVRPNDRDGDLSFCGTKKGFAVVRKPLSELVGRTGIEPVTNGLKVLVAGILGNTKMFQKLYSATVTALLCGAGDSVQCRVFM
jgi:hypothetical protein